MSDTGPAWLTPAEMAARTGTTIDTLRYYEKERLITGVARAGIFEIRELVTLAATR